MADYSSEDETDMLGTTAIDIPSLIDQIDIWIDPAQINPTPQPVAEEAPASHLSEAEGSIGQFSLPLDPISDYSIDEDPLRQFATAGYPFRQVTTPEATVSKPPTTEDSVSPLTASKATFSDLTAAADSVFQLTALEATFSDQIATADSVSHLTASEATFSGITETGDSASQLTTLEAPVPKLETDESLFLRHATPVKDFFRNPVASTSKACAASGATPLIEKDEDYTCHICGKKFINQNFLRFHLITDHAQSIPSTSAFNPTLDSKPLEAYGKQSGVGEYRVCSICKKKFLSDGILNRQKSDLRGNKYFICNECPMKFIRKAMRAISTPIPERRFPCDVCGCRFASPKDLEMHFKIVHALTCFACKKSFRRNESLEKHRKKCMSKSKIEARRGFTCAICGKTFTSRYNLHYHVLSHSQDKRFTCPVCARSFSSQLHLILHQNCHPKGRP